MPNDTYLSFYLNTSRLHIFSKTIIEIGNPKFIRFLVKEDGQYMIMEAYHKKDFQSHRVPKRAEGKWEMEVRSLPLCSLLKNRLNWEDGKSYRIPGKTYPKQRLAVFDLSEAEQIQQLSNQTHESTDH